LIAGSRLSRDYYHSSLLFRIVLGDLGLLSLNMELLQVPRALLQRMTIVNVFLAPVGVVAVLEVNTTLGLMHTPMNASMRELLILHARVTDLNSVFLGIV
jgi:hypothetical protein